MKWARIRGLTAVLVVSATSVSYGQGWSGGDFAARIVARIDSNGNGQIDSDEFEQMHSGFRSALERDGVRPPISNDRFTEMMPRVMEEMRRGSSWGRRDNDDDDDNDRGSSWGRDRDDDDDDDNDRGRGGFGYSSSRGGYDRGGSSSSSDKSKEKVRVTVDIPEKYVTVDTDADGQLGLYEWRQWRPAELGLFFAIDANKDGLLTARELLIAESFPPSVGEVAAGASPTPAPPPTSASTPPTERPPAGTDSLGNPAATPNGEKPSAAEARYVFSALDKNRNGQLEESEWQSSKTIRQGFTDAGATLRLPATLEIFLADYPYERVVPQMRLR